jgi:hypothetical protein
MSSIADAAVVPIARIAELRAAAIPKKRFLRGVQDEFPATLAKVGQPLAAFDGQGSLVTLALSYLENGGEPMKSSARTSRRRPRTSRRCVSTTKSSPNPKRRAQAGR